MFICFVFLIIDNLNIKFFLFILNCFFFIKGVRNKGFFGLILFCSMGGYLFGNIFLRVFLVEYSIVMFRRKTLLVEIKFNIVFEKVNLELRYCLLNL